MKINKNTLLETLNILYRIVPLKSVITYTQSFLFTAKENTVELRASDGNITIKVEIPADEINGEQFCVPARVIIDALRTISDDDITILKEDNNIRLVWGSGNIVVPDLGYEFPAFILPEVESSLQVDGSMFSQALDTLLFCVGNDDLRPAISCVYLDIKDGKAFAVATDQRVLIKCNAGMSPSSGSLLLPLAFAKLFKMLPAKDSVLFDISKTSYVTHAGDYTIICSLVNVKYPNYESVIPKTNNSELEIKSAELLYSIKRISTCADENQMLISLSIGGQGDEGSITLSSKNINDTGKKSPCTAQETIPCKYTGEPLKISFKATQLSDAISNIKAENLRILFIDEKHPATIKDADDEERLTCIIMPMLSL